MILSSECARADLVRVHPDAAARSAVLRFVPDIDLSSGWPTRAELAARHGIDGPYLHLPNQYWAHKNHRVVIEALALLRDQGRDVRVVSTGSPSDYRNPDHYATLTARIDALGVGDHYRRLGVVPYRDLLALMRDAVGVVNPSLFEGWSTTVERDQGDGQADRAVRHPRSSRAGPRARRVLRPTHDARALADALCGRCGSEVHGGRRAGVERAVARPRRATPRIRANLSIGRAARGVESTTSQPQALAA